MLRALALVDGYRIGWHQRVQSGDAADNLPIFAYAGLGVPLKIEMQARALGSV